MLAAAVVLGSHSPRLAGCESTQWPTASHGCDAKTTTQVVVLGFREELSSELGEVEMSQDGLFQWPASDGVRSS